MKEEYKLHNPVWHSLNEVHKNYGVDCEGIKFYLPEYCRFGGSIEGVDSMQGLNEYSNLINNFYMVGNKPNFSNLLRINKQIFCNQMILKEVVDVQIEEDILELKSAIQQSDLFDLVNLVQPGYFVERTFELGQYFGIYKNGELVAVTGERMKMNNYTEVSAIVTHIKYRRKGYAKQLINYTTRKILDENKTPYLHVSALNIGAIKLYETLGFETRRKITFWNLTTEKNL